MQQQAKYINCFEIYYTINKYIIIYLITTKIFIDTSNNILIRRQIYHVNLNLSYWYEYFA